MNLTPELGSGPLDAAVWLVGRDALYDGAYHDRQMLDGLLKIAGWQPHDVRVERLNPKASRDPADVAWGQWRLEALLSAHRPKLVIAAGDEAARWLLADAWPDEPCATLRGYLWDTRFGRVMTTVEPHDFFARAGASMLPWTPWRALLNLDVRRAAAEVAAGCQPLDHRTVTIVTDPRELDELRETIHDAGRSRGRGVAGKDAGRHAGGQILARRDASNLVHMQLPRVSGGSSTGWLAVDIENTADLTLACVGFAPSTERAWVIPAQEPWQLAAIRDLCESPVPKVLQNGAYDRFFLRRFCGIDLRSQVFDTMLGWHSLQPELAGKKLQLGARRKTYSRTTVKSLKFLASIYTRDAWFKNYQFETEEDRYILCGKDCAVTLDIAQKQVTQLESP